MSWSSSASRAQRGERLLVLAGLVLLAAAPPPAPRRSTSRRRGAACRARGRAGPPARSPAPAAPARWGRTPTPSPRPPRPHEAADRLREVQRRRRARGVDPDGEPRHVDALGHHSDRDHPPLGRRAEPRDPLRGPGLVGQDERRRRAGDVGEDRGVGAGSGLVGGDDEAAGVGHAAECGGRSSRLSAAASTAGIHSPPGSSAVRQARAVCSAVSGSPRRAVISSPALVRQLDTPE